MKKNLSSKLSSNAFALIAAAFLMTGSVACSTAPVQEEASIEASAPLTDSSTTEVSTSQLDSSLDSSAPVVQETPDTFSGAPSSLGASSSGRGH